MSSCLFCLLYYRLTVVVCCMFVSLFVCLFVVVWKCALLFCANCIIGLLLLPFPSFPFPVLCLLLRHKHPSDLKGPLRLSLLPSSPLRSLFYCIGSGTMHTTSGTATSCVRSPHFLFLISILLRGINNSLITQTSYPPFRLCFFIVTLIVHCGLVWRAVGSSYTFSSLQRKQANC
ncbi:MAG: hypothetical protein JOS17DRAFT_365603 [Linnemannia elongata]|nr:MAG: hypothetical protein JOS17DRAFT_365603 [Linnemannia elongata]